MNAKEIMAAVKSDGFDKHYAELNWTGTFEQYLNMVLERPAIARTAFQRMYDMVIEKGYSEYVDVKKQMVHYRFFDDEDNDGKDAVFGLDVPLMKLVHFFKSAAFGYGTEKRVLLLHSPVGSAKSTIARLLKKGIERYSRTEEGALYSFKWVDGKDAGDHTLEVDVTMDELAAILGEELELPDIQDKGKSKISNAHDRYSGIRRVGPESLRHFKRTYR